MPQDLIKRVLSGDLDAYEEIVRQFQAMLLGYAAHRLPDIDTAQEVVQLTFIRAYQQLSEYQPERDFGVWLCVICKHFILTELERQRRESRNVDKFSHTLRLRVAEVMAGAGDQGQTDLHPLLRECLKQLQTQAATVVRLRYEEQQSCQHIAERLGRTLTWVTSTLSRARQALRQCIERRQAEESAI